jgi:hypothetical protein
MSYLTSLPPKALVIQAGFSKDESSGRPLLKSYVIPRGRVQPPDELLEMVLPWLEAALAAVKEVGGFPFLLGEKSNLLLPLCGT